MKSKILYPRTICTAWPTGRGGSVERYQRERRKRVMTRGLGTLLTVFAS